MKKSGIHSYTILALSLVLSAAVIAMTGCGGSTTSSNANTGTVSTFLSDPPTPTCSDNFAGVYVTITEVDANLNANAGPNDSGWQTLVKLSPPQQVNLMMLYPSPDNPNFCGTLYMLAKQQLPPGKYQQIRLILLANNASGTVSNNACTTGGFNCVVPKNPDGTPGTPIELQLPSEAQTGIKIPASQIANGGLTVIKGQNTDFNIDINSCASIVKAGNSGQYLLKPVLHAGEVSINNSVISGKVVEADTAPSPGSPVADAIVLLEQPDPNDASIDRVVPDGTATTASDGTFSFCPLPATGNFDIVVTGQTTESGATTTTTTYNPTVLFKVPIGSQVGSIPIYAETVAGTSGLITTNPATITGTIATAGSGGAVSGTVQISALQQVTNNSSNINLTIPVFGAMSEPTEFTTASGTSCPSGTDCTSYSLPVPASSPAMGTYSSSSSFTFTPPNNEAQAAYTVNAVADGSDSLLTCSPTSTTSNSFTVKSGDTAAPASGTGVTVVEPSLAFSFTGCQ